jgi:MFS family permease
MPAALKNVAALIAAVAILQMGSGLLGVQLPLAMSGDNLKGAAIGLVQAAYSVGFLAGAWFGPRMLARVGHIRVFAACAALASAGTLAVYAVNDAVSWSILRAITGGCIALLFAAVESWMGASVTKDERGGVIGIYMVATKAALALGPFLTFGAPSGHPAPIMLAAALFALAVVPVCLTTANQPDAPSPQPLALQDQYQVAPAAVIACFGAGFMNAGVLGLAPLYAAAHYGEQRAAVFQAAAWFGSLLLQWPAGKLSDRIDRRLVIAGLCGIAAVASLPLALLGQVLPFGVSAVLFSLWGAGALSFYGIAVAHMADRAEPGRIAQAASGLLFIWGAGAILGPVALGVAVEGAGQGALFWFSGICAAGLTGYMLMRRREREETKQTEKEVFAPKHATSVAAAEMAYGDEAADAPPKPV